MIIIIIIIIIYYVILYSRNHASGSDTDMQNKIKNVISRLSSASVADNNETSSPLRKVHQIKSVPVPVPINREEDLKTKERRKKMQELRNATSQRVMTRNLEKRQHEKYTVCCMIATLYYIGAILPSFVVLYNSIVLCLQAETDGRGRAAGEGAQGEEGGAALLETEAA